MKIISTTDLSREGNDCYIYESVSLVAEFGLYSVITCTKVVGWCEFQDVCFQGKPTTDIEEAKHRYWEYGGNLNAVQE
jgi:hypothetical protein